MITLVPLAAIGSALMTVATSAAVFGWFVSWISSVVILDLCTRPHINVPAFVIALLVR